MKPAVLSKSVWHQFQAYKLENDLVSIEIVPELGAKIVSIFDKTQQFEWLVPPSDEVIKTEFGMLFTDQNMCGWDEMLPTIVACDWNGFHFPDHGSVWSVPWETIEKDHSIENLVTMQPLCCRFGREISLSGSTVSLKYMLRNESELQCPWLWAAHPQFTATPESRVLFPESVTHIINVTEDDPVLGAAGSLHRWPRANESDDKPLDRLWNPESKSCRKIYLQPEQPANYAQITQGQAGSSLKMSWDSKQTPYLGLWIDEKTYNKIPTIAIEPSNGFYDSLTTAIKNNRAAVISPGETVFWEIHIKLSSQNDMNTGRRNE
jgi:galactose mutarotase-like enzyme